MGAVPSIDDWQEEIERAFSNPIGSPKLEEIVKKKGKKPGDMTVSVTVSDITRPVPYKGEKGILGPVLRVLESQGLRRENIKIIVGTGMHRASTREEKVQMYGEEVVDQFTVLDHDCENEDLLASIGRTKRDTHVYVNKDFYFADLKIATGLVESHFMTGVSGGRKAVCPGLVDVKTIEKFHGPYYLEDPNATNLILDGNPCHEEALEVAKTVGVDFMVNVTLDKDMRLTRVFAGDLVEAHMEAFEMIKAYAEIPLERQFDVVLTHGGYVGRDHYQTAKAGVGAIPAVKPGGQQSRYGTHRLHGIQDLKPSVKNAEAGWILGFAPTSRLAVYEGPMGAGGLGEAPHSCGRAGTHILLWRNPGGGLRHHSRDERL